MEKILLIEDDRDIQSINTFFLKSRGYEVHCAYSCEEGLSACRAVSPEVIVLDVNLPDGTGLELCPRLQGGHLLSDHLSELHGHGGRQDRGPAHRRGTTT